MRAYSLAFAAILGLGLIGCGDDDGGNNDNGNDAGVNQNDAGTGDDGGSNNNNNNNAFTLDELDGTFELTSIEIPQGGGTSVTFTRTEAAVTFDGSNVLGMVRGYMDLTASGDASGVAELLGGLVLDHRPEGLMNVAALGITLEPAANKLVLGWPDGDVVVLFDYDGTVLTLTLDKNDVRNQDVDGFPDEMVYTRFTPTANELTGSWGYTSMIMDRGGSPATITNTCSAMGGSTWARLSGSITLRDLGYYTGTVLISEFDNATCNGTATNTEAMEFLGFQDVDETNDVLEMYQWMVTQGVGVGATYDYTLNGTTLTLDLDTLYPNDGGGATQLVMEKL